MKTDTLSKKQHDCSPSLMGTLFFLKEAELEAHDWMVSDSSLAMDYGHSSLAMDYGHAVSWKGSVCFSVDFVYSNQQAFSKHMLFDLACLNATLMDCLFC